MTIDELNRHIRSKESFLLAADGEYIGKLSTNKYDIDSVCNKYGRYGSIYGSKSIWNQYGHYGSKYSSLSPYNIYSINPPAIYLYGRLYGYLTCNQNKLGVKLSPDHLIDWMIENNL